MTRKAPIDSRTGVTPASVVADAVHAMLTERFGANVRVMIADVRTIAIQAASPDYSVTNVFLRERYVRAAIVAAGLPAQERMHAAVTTTASGGVLLAW